MGEMIWGISAEWNPMTLYLAYPSQPAYQYLRVECDCGAASRECERFAKWGQTRNECVKDWLRLIECDGM